MITQSLLKRISLNIVFIMLFFSRVSTLAAVIVMSSALPPSPVDINLVPTQTSQAQKIIPIISAFAPVVEAAIYDSMDWRGTGVVTHVKDEGQTCQSSYAFAATGALESQIAILYGNLEPLSEQNLIDCSLKQGNKGCDGGHPAYAFLYVTKNGGIDTEASYPYEGHLDSCRYDPGNAGGRAQGYMYIESENENELKIAVATYGPVAAEVDGTNFPSYTSGIYYDLRCSSTELNRAVLVVGYGTENGVDYWTVKNSMGPDWGEDGYIRMARNQNNNCGIATNASVPIVL